MPSIQEAFKIKMNKLFVFQKGKNPDYEPELLSAFNKCDRKNEKINLGGIKVDDLDKKSVGVVVSSGLPKEWYFILKGLNIVSITFGGIDKYLNLSDIVIDYKSLNNNRYFTGPNYSIRNNPEIDFEEISDLITKLDWDSRFWGFSVGYLSSKHLTENIIYRIEEVIKKNKFRLVEYLCNCHDSRSVKTAEKYGFHFTDIRLSFEKALNTEEDILLPDKVVFAKAKAKDILRLKEISEGLYRDSRYFFDDNFDRSKVREFYQCWIERAVLGKFDDACYCLYEKGLPLGFCSVKYNFVSKTANIGLFGVSSKYQGRGLGKLLLYTLFDKLKDEGINKVFVVTQGRNYAAQRLYQSAGFRTQATELWYHKWL